jgi:parallel beta-helix repeat protein
MFTEQEKNKPRLLTRNIWGLFSIFIIPLLVIVTVSSDTYWSPNRAYAYTGFSTQACNGDLNQDGQIDDSDLPLLAIAVLTNNTSGLCADLNEDQAVNSLDLQHLVNLILNPLIPGNAYYIAPNGSDSNDGSLERPWATVMHAWRNSGRGDTVYVRQGSYSEGRDIWLAGGNGNEAEYWTLRAYPGETATFTNARFIADSDYIRIQGLTLTGSSYMQAVSWDDLHNHIEFLNNDISGSATVPIYFNTNNGRVEGNTIHSTSAVHGIYLMHGDSNVVRNNIVTGMSKYGIHIYDENKYSRTARITNLLVENNTVSGSHGRSGIIVSAGESTSLGIEINGVVIRNNVVFNNAEDGITIRYYGSVRNVEIYNNVVYGNRAVGLRISAYNADNITAKNNIFSSNPIQIDVSSSLNNFILSHNLYHQPDSVGRGAQDQNPNFGDPLFVNPSAGEFHLQANSPAIDAGIDVGLPYSGSAPDLGAFEYSP